MDMSLPHFPSFVTLPTSACLAPVFKYFCWYECCNVSIHHQQTLGPKVSEGNRTLCREGDASIAMIPTIHGTFFRGLTVIVLLVPIHDRHSRAEVLPYRIVAEPAVWKLRRLNMSAITKWWNRKWGWLAARVTICWIHAHLTFLKLWCWTLGDCWSKDISVKGLSNYTVHDIEMKSHTSCSYAWNVWT
jgi:hypothetical protein